MSAPERNELASELALIRRASLAAARRLWTRAALVRLATVSSAGATVWLLLALVSRLGELDLALASAVAAIALATWLLRELICARTPLVAGAQALDRAGDDATDVVATALELGDSPGIAAALTRERASEHLRELAGARVPPLWPGERVALQLGVAATMLAAGVALVQLVGPHQTAGEREQEALQRYASELRAAGGGGAAAGTAGERAGEEVQAALEHALAASSPVEATEAMAALEQALAQAAEDRRESESSLSELEARLLQSAGEDATGAADAIKRALDRLPPEERDRIAAQLAELGERAATDRARAIALLQLAASSARQQLSGAGTPPDGAALDRAAGSTAIAYDAGQPARPGRPPEPPATHRELVDRYFEILDAR